MLRYKYKQIHAPEYLVASKLYAGYEYELY